MARNNQAGSHDMTACSLRCLVLGAGLAALSAPALAQQEITIATSGGIVQEAGNAVLWGPAATEMGITVREETFDDGLQALRLQNDAGAVTYDIVQLPPFQAEIALKDGLIQPLDYTVIDAAGFPPEAATEACIGTIQTSWVLAYNTEVYGDNPPRSWADFWNVEAFPGRRGMHNDAESQLEMALMADGVPMDQVYDVLRSDGGVERAVAKLAEIKPDVAVWWSSGAQSVQIMQDNEVDMAVMWNGRAESVIEQGAPVDFTWNEGIKTGDCWTVPTAAPHRDLAMQMINAISQPAPQAEFALRLKYGPMNAQAFDTGIIPPEVAERFPSYPANAAQMLAQDASWWAENTGAADVAFDDMMAQ